MNTLDMSAALALRKLSKKVGASNKMIAEACGLSVTCVSKVFHFKRCLSFSEVCLFCEKFNINISEMSKLTKKFSEDEKVLSKLNAFQKSLTQSRVEISLLLDSLTS